MKAVVVYESMYGNTHRVAEAVARGLGAGGATVDLVPVAGATREVVAGADLVVVGGPTHVHGMSRPGTRRSAAGVAARPGSGLHLEPRSEEAGVREWLEGLDGPGGPAVAFDTRMPGPAVLTGSASRVIARRLSRHGFRVIASPESFLVDKDNHLRAGEEERASVWGARLAALLAPV